MRLTLSWPALVPGGSGSMADPLFMVQPGLLGASDTWSSTITQGFEEDAPARPGGLEVSPPKDPQTTGWAKAIPPDRSRNMKVQMPCEFGADHVFMHCANSDSVQGPIIYLHFNTFGLLLQFCCHNIWNAFFKLIYHSAKYLGILRLLVSVFWVIIVEIYEFVVHLMCVHYILLYYYVMLYYIIIIINSVMM